MPHLPWQLMVCCDLFSFSLFEIASEAVLVAHDPVNVAADPVDWQKVAQAVAQAAADVAASVSQAVSWG